MVYDIMALVSFIWFLYRHSVHSCNYGAKQVEYAIAMHEMEDISEDTRRQVYAKYVIKSKVFTYLSAFFCILSLLYFVFK